MRTHLRSFYAQVLFLTAGAGWAFAADALPPLLVPPMRGGLSAADTGSPAGGDAKRTAALQAAAALYDGIRSETLPNGLRVYLKPIPGADVVTTMVAYKVGSADEDLDHTGLSHYLEHLMFKGTEKIMPGDIDRVTLRNGGQNNASTSEDYTLYYFDFAADRWEAALDIEADRMRNLRIDNKHEFEQEKGAVISELERDEDLPWDLEQKAILPLLFGKMGPYGHPVIGERAHVRAATAQIIKSHYDRWYHPNNAALVIVGGIDADKALDKIKKLFGPIPEAQLPARKRVPKETTARPTKLEIESKFEVPRMLLGLNTVSNAHPDFHTLEVIQTLLANGKTSRLYKRLVEEERVASQVSASNNAGRYPGWFAVSVELLKGKDRARVEELVLRELARLRESPVSTDELKRAQQQILASNVFGRESVHDLADMIARGVTTTNLDFLKNYLPQILAVTADDIQRVAKTYFEAEKRAVVWSVPPAAGQCGGSTETQTLGYRPPYGSRSGQRQASAPAAASAGFNLKDAQRVELPNGLTLLLLENRRLPIFVAQALVRRVGLLEPEAQCGVARLMGSLLEEGTTKHTGPQIAEAIENVGGTLSMGSSGGSILTLSSDRSLGLGLLFECLMHANFPKEAFEREREKLLSLIDDAEQQPQTRAQQTFREAVYGRHPLGRPSLGRRKSVEKLKPLDCAVFHHELFAPNNTIVACVGDFDSKQLIDEITQLTANWNNAPVPKATPPAVSLPAEFTQKIVTMPAAAQLNFFMGHVGIRRNDPDFYKLRVMDYVLGTGSGFTDRLSAQLRDREGLAYTVSANITGSAGEEPGLFTCFIGTQPENFGKVKTRFLEELKRIRDEKPTDEEVEDAKKFLLGSLPFELTTCQQVAGQLVHIERFNLGFDYFDKYRKAIASVTAADVQNVAREHLDPQHMVLIAAGPIDGQGKPLAKKP